MSKNRSFQNCSILVPSLLVRKRKAKIGRLIIFREQTKKKWIVMAVSMKSVKPIELPFEGPKRYVLFAGEKASVSIVEVDPKITTFTGPFKHDYEEYIYVLKGEFELNYPDLGKSWMMKPGWGKFHPINTSHTAAFHGKGKSSNLGGPLPPTS
jgi:quercetin dioxygenase-like cupin family protein